MIICIKFLAKYLTQVNSQERPAVIPSEHYHRLLHFTLQWLIIPNCGTDGRKLPRTISLGHKLL